MLKKAKEHQADTATEKGSMKDSVAGQKDRGNTMVEVIASFAILTMMAAVFADVFMTGSHAVERTARIIEEKDALYEAYHLGEGLQAEPIGGGTIRFVPVDGDGLKDGFVLDGLEVYAHTSTEGVAGTVYDVRLEK